MKIYFLKSFQENTTGLKKSIGIIVLFSIMIGSNCNLISNTSSKENITMSKIKKKEYGMTSDGIPVKEFTLTNSNGMEVKIITLGGIITSWTAPDKNDIFQNVVLGLSNVEEYEGDHPYFGALIGRYGNRIAQGQFEINEQTFELPINNGENHLHGGPLGFHTVIWAADDNGTDENGSFLKLSYDSPDGEMGYPGNLKVKVAYTLTNDNALEIEYKANTDKTTHCNLTQHSYFNLSGDFNQTILDHELSIIADQYIPVDRELIPTGELAQVKGTPFDFTTPKLIGKDINTGNQQLELGLGYDHCWVLNGSGMRKVAEAHHPESGRVLEVYTDEPGVQFYSGNFLDGTSSIPEGGTYQKRAGFCLETQHYPDSPNQSHFPSTLLNPWELYQSKTTYKLSVIK